MLNSFFIFSLSQSYPSQRKELFEILPDYQAPKESSLAALSIYNATTSSPNDMIRAMKYGLGTTVQAHNGKLSEQVLVNSIGTYREMVHNATPPEWRHLLNLGDGGRTDIRTEGIMFINFATIKDLLLQTDSLKAAFNLVCRNSPCPTMASKYFPRWLIKEAFGMAADTSNIELESMAIFDAVFLAFDNEEGTSSGYYKIIRKIQTAFDLTRPQVYLVTSISAWLEMELFFLRFNKPAPVLGASSYVPKHIIRVEDRAITSRAWSCGGIPHMQSWMMEVYKVLYDLPGLGQFDINVDEFFRSFSALAMLRGQPTTNIALGYGSEMSPELLELKRELMRRAREKAGRTIQGAWRKFKAKKYEEMSDNEVNIVQEGTYTTTTGCPCQGEWHRSSPWQPALPRDRREKLRGLQNCSQWFKRHHFNSCRRCGTSRSVFEEGG